MSIDLNPSSPIAIRFLQDLQLNGKGTRTQQSYGRALRRFKEFLRRDPDTASEDDLRRYMLHIKQELLWSPSTINVAQCGLKQFFKFTCPRDCHPHVHFVVPGGAIGRDGVSWLSSRADYFVPVLDASPSFRAKFKAEMKRCGLLDAIPKEVWQVAWNINSKAVGDGRSSLKYLAPYVFRVAIGNHRIVSVTPGPDGQGQVVYKYRPSGTRRYRTITVTAEEFLRRFLQHVLPRGFQKVRHFGFMHPRSKTDWQWLSMLVTVSLNPVYVLTVMAKPQLVRRVAKCPHCGGELAFRCILPPGNAYDGELDSS